MKKIFLLFAFIRITTLGAIPLPADIPITIVVPRQAEPLDDTQLAMLSNKMLEYAVRSGITAGEGYSPIAMLPIIAIEKEDVVEGGMRNLTVLSADITFLIKNLETGVIYSSIHKRVRGSGTNYQRALNDCISKISLQSEEFSQFVKKGRDKINDYYRANCASLLSQAEAYAKTQKYEEALALAYSIIASIPSTADCYVRALAMLEKIYLAYQKYHCEDILNKANTLWGGHQYREALEILYDLKTFGTDCNKKVTALITTIESRLTDNEMREWRLYEERLKTKAYLEEKLIEAAKEIGVAYFGRTIFRNYNYLGIQRRYIR